MNNKIDVNDIMKNLEEKIKKGLEEKSMDLTDISILINKHIEKAKEKILTDTSNILTETKGENDICKECGGTLKKTKK